MPGNLNGYAGDGVAIFFCGARKLRRRRRGWPSGEPARRIIAVNPDRQSVQWIGAATHASSQCSQCARRAGIR
jgi:hypothetical protein